MEANVANAAPVVQVAIANIVANQAVKPIVVSWVTFVAETTVVNQAKFVLKLV